MRTVARSFDAVSDNNSRILILGTMPSVQSRAANFYYAHPRNRFWQVLAECFSRPLPITVEEKTRLLLDNRLALWDVLAVCDIRGSDDASIRNPVYNDIATLITDKPIEKILCNGKKAYELCRRLGLTLPVVCMPSTSPANAAWNAERLTAAWKRELTV